jgi:hypothetical protein
MKTIVALITTVFLATSSAFAGSACCANKDGKMECAQIYAKLNLTPDQKSKLDTFQARCEKDGCTEESMDKFFSSAKEVLSAEQYAQLKSECSSMQPHTAKSAN